MKTKMNSIKLIDAEIQRKQKSLNLWMKGIQRNWEEFQEVNELMMDVN